MFHKTKIQLVSLFTLFFFLILSVLGMILYIFMYQHAYDSIDDKLRHKEVTLSHDPHKEFIEENERELERKISVLVWDQDGDFLFNEPKYSFLKHEITSLRPSKTDEKFRTQKLGGHSYRILTHVINENENKRFPSNAIIQFVYNVDPEVTVLNKLLLFIGVGCAVGLLLSFIVGLFLANRALVPIQRSWEKQAQFVGDASHELRTPLAIIQTNLEMLFRHPDYTIEQESPTIFKSLSEVKRLNRLVEDLLTLARTDSNEQLIHSETFSIEEFLLPIVNQFESIAETKNIQFVKEIEKNVFYTGDKERIHQLFVILLDNALKYTSSGGQVKITSAKMDAILQIEIEDTGKGIAEKDVPYIFDRFYRSDKERARTTGGTGLGLSIAKWIVEAHGGKIYVESFVKKGTRFIIKLPLK